MTLAAIWMVSGYVLGLVGFLAVVSFVAYIMTEVFILSAKGKIRRKAKRH